MSIEIKVPSLPESVTDATVAKWYKKVGDRINRDENLVDLETDKVMLEVPAPKAGIIEKILVTEGELVKTDALLAIIVEAGAESTAEIKSEPKSEPKAEPHSPDLSPSVRRMAAEQSVNVSELSGAGSGKGGRLTKSDLEAHLSQQKPPVSLATGDRQEKRVPMSRLRARIAERLVQVQHEAALLTTFNEVNMKPVMDLRNKYKDAFEKAHGARLGFMSFFTKAACEALKRFPAVNASLDGNDLIYHDYCDVGIAIGSDRGLVVPILRNAERLSMADIEKTIREFAEKANSGKLAMEDMMGGTFTITNGGTYGSMLSTPIINPPQTAILGMHNIVERPVAENGQVVIRPVMYLALSYDHRVIDGREAVLFLRTIKEAMEDPARLLLEV
jgi:2-oxoglutarate dehydrogenase E2 component (dihydrolipoamide succinyltransferase)